MANKKIVLGDGRRICLTNGIPPNKSKIILSDHEIPGSAYKIFVVDMGVEYPLARWLEDFASINHGAIQTQETLYDLGDKIESSASYYDPQTHQTTTGDSYIYLPADNPEQETYDRLDYFSFSGNISSSESVRRNWSSMYEYTWEYLASRNVWYVFDFNATNTLSANTSSGCRVDSCELIGEYGGGAITHAGTVTIRFNVSYLLSKDTTCNPSGTGILSRYDSAGRDVSGGFDDIWGHHWSGDKPESHHCRIISKEWREAAIDVKMDVTSSGDTFSLGAPRIDSGGTFTNSEVFKIVPNVHIVSGGGTEEGPREVTKSVQVSTAMNLPQFIIKMV